MQITAHAISNAFVTIIAFAVLENNIWIRLEKIKNVNVREIVLAVLTANAALINKNPHVVVPMEIVNVILTALVVYNANAVLNFYLTKNKTFKDKKETPE